MGSVLVPAYIFAGIWMESKCDGESLYASREQYVQRAKLSSPPPGKRKRMRNESRHDA